MNYIFDIDNTLADCSHRLKYLRLPSKEELESNEPTTIVKPDWDSFHNACVDDTPIIHNIKLMRELLLNANNKVMFLTGRPESSRRMTSDWIIYNIKYFMSRNIETSLSNNIYMRKDNDHREDWVIKLEHLDRLGLDKTQTIIFDDRDQVVQNLRAAGWTVFQVCNGTY